MDNTEKLLRALIDALGFEVDETKDYDEKEISEEDGFIKLKHPDYCYIDIDSAYFRLVFSESSDGKKEYKRGESNSYFLKRINPIIDYKLTKKVPIELETKAMTYEERLKADENL